MNEFLVSLPNVPDWISSISFDKFVPFIIDVMMTASVGIYDYFVPILSALVWVFITFNIAVFMAKQFFPASWLEFFGFKDGGGFYSDASGKIKMTAWGIPERLAKQVIRATVATSLMLVMRPAFVTDVIINPFLDLGTTYTEFVVAEVGGGLTEIPSPAVCAEGTAKGFFDDAICSKISNPLSQIIYKNNQVITLGLSMMNPLGVNVFDVGQKILDMLLGLAFVITFFISGFYLASLVLQCVLNFCYEVMLFPFKAFRYAVQENNDWFNPMPAFQGIINSIRDLIVTLIVSGIMTIVNMALINAMFGTNGSFNLGGWGDKFMAILGCVLTFAFMHKLFTEAKGKIKQFGAPADETLYKQLSENIKRAGSLTTKFIENAKKMGARK